MAGRRNLTKDELDNERFKLFVRYMIVASEKKRLVEYSEITKVFGIPLEDIRDYAGFLGDYCETKKYPYLNSLIINTTDGMPGEDFFTWAEDNKDNWGEYVAHCFSYFHLPIDNSVRFRNTSGINEGIDQFLNE